MRVCIPVQLVAGAARAGVEQRGHIEEDAAGERVAIDRKPWVGSRSREIVHALRDLPWLHRSTTCMQTSERTLSPQVCTCPPKPNGDYESDEHRCGEAPGSGQRDAVAVARPGGNSSKTFAAFQHPLRSISQAAQLDAFAPSHGVVHIYRTRDSETVSTRDIALVLPPFANRPRLFRQLRWRLPLSSGTAVPSAASSSAQRSQAQAIVQCASSRCRSARGKVVST